MVETASARADPWLFRLLSGPVKEGMTPGLVAAILDPDGVRSIAAAGVRKQGSDEEIAVDDLVHIGSNTKAMTSVMLAQLVADGVFPDGWNTTIGEVFPELVGRIHPSHKDVCLDGLLRVRGGIPSNAVDWRAYRHFEIRQRRYRILRTNLEGPPEAPSGTFLYSNLSYMAAGAMAERLTGQSWEELMMEHVFHPLEIRTAGFGWPGTSRTVNQPWGHRRGNDGVWTPSQHDNSAALGPAGTVHLSIADYARFLKIWFRGTEPEILDRNRLDNLATPQSGEYAAGWIILRRDWAAGDVLTHSGSNTYWYATVWIAPGIGRTYLAVANSADKGTPQMLDAIIGELIQHGS